MYIPYKIVYTAIHSFSNVSPNTTLRLSLHLFIYNERPARGLRISTALPRAVCLRNVLPTPLAQTVDAADVTCAKNCFCNARTCRCQETSSYSIMNDIVPIDPSKSESYITTIRTAFGMNLAHIRQGSATSVLPFARGSGLPCRVFQT